MKLPETRRAPRSIEQRAHLAKVERIRTEARAERARGSSEAAAQRERKAWDRIGAEERAEQAQARQEQATRAWTRQFEEGGR